MTWLCSNCDHGNVWWRNVCESCNVPTRGFDPKPVPEDPLLVAMREAILAIERQPVLSPPLTGGVRFDCSCPMYGTCMNTACPRAARVTS